MAKLKRTKYPKSKSVEKQEIAVLEDLFNDTNILTDLTHGDDDFPNIDGYLHLLNKKREMIGQILQVQIKPVRYKKGSLPVSSVKVELLAHAYESSTPVLVLAVDVEKGLAYWLYLSPESVKDVITSAGSPKTTTINFPKKNVIEKGGAEYVNEWRRICLYHRNESNDKIMTRLIRQRKKEKLEKQISTVSLESLSDLVLYRTNSGEYPFFDYALSLAPEVCKCDEDAKLRYMEILERIYYNHVADVLKILLDLALDKNEKVTEKARKILLEAANYNIHVLNTLGYGPHRILVDALRIFIDRGDKRVTHLATEILQNVLSSSFEGTSHSDQATITFHRGPLEPTPYLQKIRRDAADLLFHLFANAVDTRERVEVLSAIFQSFHAPAYPFADENAQARYFAMVNTEAANAIRKFKKIAFASRGVLSQEYPVVYEMERQMSWLTAWKREVYGLQSLLTALRTTKSDYSFYRLVMGDEHDLAGDQDFDTTSKIREENIQQRLDSITKENADEWLDRLEKVAAFSDIFNNTRDSWKFNVFRDFLARIGKHKPEIAEYMLVSIFDKHGVLYPLAGNFVFGLRQSSIALWDKYVDRIEKHESEELTRAILMSFEFHPISEVKEKIRAKDIDLLGKIVQCQDGFAFLKDRRDRPFLYQCMRAALYIYQTDPKRCRALIVELLKSHPDKASLFLDEIGFALCRRAKWLMLDDWEKVELDALADALVEVQRLDHNEEQLLLAVGQRNFETMILVFDRRLKRKLQEQTDFSFDPPRFSHYDAIPHRFFNQELVKFISEHLEYKNALRRWVDGITDEYSAESLALSQLIRLIGGPALGKLIQDLVTSGKKENVRKVLVLFPLIETPDFRLCFQIIDATDDKDIINNVSSKMRNVGVMSGSYGDDLYGKGLRSVKERLEREGLTYPSKKVKDFSAKMIHNLDKDIAESAERNRKQLQQDKEEFEESALD